MRETVDCDSSRRLESSFRDIGLSRFCVMMLFYRYL